MLNLAIRLRRVARKIIARSLDIPTFAITRIFGSHLTITYDNSAKKDGLGAQIQRVLAINALAKLLHISYFHSGLKDVAVHPLDPYQKPDEYFAFIKDVNDFIQLPSDSPVELSISSDFAAKRRIKSRYSLVSAVFTSWWNKADTLYFLTEPYFIVDSWPSAYGNCVTQLFSGRLSQFFDSYSDEIVIHYRWGVGGMAIQNGEKYPRELPIEYFTKVLDVIIQLNNNKKFERITILTDAPESEVVYEPPDDQIELWEGSPGFSNGQMFVKGANFFNIFNEYAEFIEVVRGGSALEAIKRMASARILIQGKSSLSYVAGLLNTTGDIYYPPNFWHPKMSKWKQLS